MSHDDDQDRPYRVGKGKPPLEHRWKKGEPSPNPKGRPKGPTAQTELMKMLGKKVWVTGSDGRRVQKSFDAVIAHKLLERAVNGDFAAIKLVTQVAMKQGVADLAAQAVAAQKQDPEELAAREELSARLVRLLEEKAAAKKATINRVRFGPDFRPIIDDGN
jgi:hypothetical protein